MNNIDTLLAIMARLRDPQAGCPWDRQQDTRSLVPHTLEEAYEVAEAAEHGSPEELRLELGDLLFQIVFYAQLAQEGGEFDFDGVVDGIATKLIRRHPHVFGTESTGTEHTGAAQVTDAAAQSLAWEAIKAVERQEKSGQSGTLAGDSVALPALTRAAKLQRRAARVGFDWPAIEPVFDKVMEELEEVRQEISGSRAIDFQSEGLESGLRSDALAIELGDLLFACVNLARVAGVDAESALRKANRKFEVRFEHMEQKAGHNQQSLAGLSAADWNVLWESVKAEEARRSTDDLRQ